MRVSALAPLGARKPQEVAQAGSDGAALNANLPHHGVYA